MPREINLAAFPVSLLGTKRAQLWWIQLNRKVLSGEYSSDDADAVWDWLTDRELYLALLARKEFQK